ncbi:hypothetical protein TNCV_960501 [Trichonephila clavipes]|nr:hypothetical protein TNCV_960501 [Trichonephila clavipes]
MFVVSVTKYMTGIISAESLGQKLLHQRDSRSTDARSLHVGLVWKFGKIWNRFLKVGNASRRSGKGRRHATTFYEGRYSTLTARRH